MKEDRREVLRQLLNLEKALLMKLPRSSQYVRHRMAVVNRGLEMVEADNAEDDPADPTELVDLLASLNIQK